MSKVFWKLKIEGKYDQDELEYIAEQIIQGNYWGTIITDLEEENK